MKKTLGLDRVTSKISKDATSIYHRNILGNIIGNIPYLYKFLHNLEIESNFQITNQEQQYL